MTAWHIDDMDAPSERENPLPDLDLLDVHALKALLVAKQSELDSRDTEIENLKLPILKLKRMQFGPRSEKLDRNIEQLELRLEDLEAHQAAAERLPIQPANRTLNSPRKPARRPLPAELPRPGACVGCEVCGRLPLYRQSEIYARAGVDLDRSTLADWVGGVSRTLTFVDDSVRYERALTLD